MPPWPPCGHYEATREVHAALAKLAAAQDPYLMRFVLILDQAGEQGPREIADLLADLQGRLRRRWTTRLAAQGVFARAGAAHWSSWSARPPR